MIDELYSRVHQLHPDLVATLDAPLGVRTTYRVGGPAALELSVGSRDALESLTPHLSGISLPVLVVGKGSNLLVADSGFDGVVIRLGQGFTEVEIVGEAVAVGGAAAMPVVARKVTRAGLIGFEWAVGVPGSIGGAVRMNAGGHGSDMAEVLVAADVLDVAEGELSRRDIDDLELSYRHSALGEHEVVVGAELVLAEGDPDAGMAKIDEIVQWRRAHQPGGQNAGSVFMNPPDDSAGRLIDEAGLRGERVGTAQVSTKHANFIQVDPGGRADDVVELMERISATVSERFGVDLVVETHLVGFGPVGGDADRPVPERPVDES